MKKTIGTIIVAVILIGAVCVGFSMFSQKNSNKQEEEKKLTEVEKVISKDLDKEYPSTPREVVKFFNRIVACYYAQEYTEEQLSALVDQALLTFDKDLKANNPKNQYLLDVKSDVKEFEDASKKISQIGVCDSDDVIYKTVEGDEIAYVTASYFIKEDSSFEKTYQMYVLRKQEDGTWKILVFYKIDAPTKTE